MHWNNKDSNGPGQAISSDANTFRHVWLPDIGTFGATLLLSHHPTNLHAESEGTVHQQSHAAKGDQ